jgi:hypothetical protein
VKSHTPPRRRTRRIHLPADPSSTDRSADGSTDEERVMGLASILEATLADDLDHPPTLVVAIDDDEGVEVRLRSLDHHPAVELEGLVAPPSWWCLGVVTGANARHLDPWPDRGDADDGEPFRVHLAQLMTRSGSSAMVLRDRRTDEVHLDRGTGEAAAALDGFAQHGGGLLDDYLRCAFGVPTPPPHRGTTDLFAALWIHRTMNEAALHRLLDAPWPAVAALHPVFDTPAATDDEVLHDWALTNLVRAGELLAEAHPWARVRSACQVGVGPVTGPPADLAGWLDDGAFARVVMTAFGPMADLLADLHELVRPDVHAVLVDTVGAWGLLDGS